MNESTTGSDVIIGMRQVKSDWWNEMRNGRKWLTGGLQRDFVNLCTPDDIGRLLVIIGTRNDRESHYDHILRLRTHYLGESWRSQRDFSFWFKKVSQLLTHLSVKLEFLVSRGKSPLCFLFPLSFVVTSD